MTYSTSSSSVTSTPAGEEPLTQDSTQEPITQEPITEIPSSLPWILDPNRSDRENGAAEESEGTMALSPVPLPEVTPVVSPNQSMALDRKKQKKRQLKPVLQVL